MAFEGPFKVTWTDSVDTVRSAVVLPFIPSKMELRNNDTGSTAQWIRQENGTQDGGTLLKGATAVTALTTTTGLNLVTTPIMAYYNDPTTPTYVDEDGDAITAGSIIDYDGGDFLARYLPTSVSGDTNSRPIGVHVQLPTNAENSDLRDDGDKLVLLAWP